MAITIGRPVRAPCTNGEKVSPVELKPSLDTDTGGRKEPKMSNTIRVHRVRRIVSSIMTGKMKEILDAARKRLSR